MKPSPEAAGLAEELGKLRDEIDAIARELDTSGLAPSERVALKRQYAHAYACFKATQAKFRAAYQPMLVKGRVVR